MKRFGISPRLLPYLCLVLAGIFAGPAHAACTNPAGNEGDQVYNGDYHTLQFCNGTSWQAFGGGSTCTVSSGYSPTLPSRNGYFVMSAGTYNAALGTNLSSFPPIDALCLTDLTTNTGWKGYSTANSNGQLVAGKVHAFICVDNNPIGGGSPCNGLMPLTTYIFANAGNPSAGGASFTTDSLGDGPYDSADWSAANYFSGSYNYWQQRNGTGTTVFPTSATAFGFGGRCSGFTTNTSGDAAIYGNSENTGLGRWTFNFATCNTSLYLICYVNP